MTTRHVAAAIAACAGTLLAGCGADPAVRAASISGAVCMVAAQSASIYEDAARRGHFEATIRTSCSRERADKVEVALTR